MNTELVLEEEVKGVTPSMPVRLALGITDVVIKELEDAYGDLDINKDFIFEMVKEPDCIYLVGKEPDESALCNEKLKELLKELELGASEKPKGQFSSMNDNFHVYERGTKVYAISFK